MKLIGLRALVLGLIGWAIVSCGDEFSSGAPPAASTGGGAGVAGAATGGAARAGGSAGHGVGGAVVTRDADVVDAPRVDATVVDANVVDSGTGCPQSVPSQGDACESSFLVCCYGVEPAKPWRCVTTTLDGGGALAWASLQSKVCCPAAAPQAGQTCNSPGDLVCCYGAVSYSCNQQPEPDAWEQGAACE